MIRLQRAFRGRAIRRSTGIDGGAVRRYNRTRGDPTMSTIREEVHKLAEKLPPDADWDDVMYEVYVRQKIAEGLRDGDEGRVVSHEEVKKRFRVS
jgi:hypothetical protein